MWFLFATGVILVVWLALVHGIITPYLRRQRALRYVRGCPEYPLPALPVELDKARYVNSQSHGHRRYRLNLGRLSCTCRRFKEQRRHYPAGDLRRLCHHLRRELDQANTLILFDELTRRIIKDRIRDKCYKKLTINGVETAIGYHPKREYMRIFTRRRNQKDPAGGPFTGPYDKFSFNAEQESWVYGEAPPGAAALAAEAIALLKEAREAFGVIPPTNRTR